MEQVLPVSDESKKESSVGYRRSRREIKKTKLDSLFCYENGAAVTEGGTPETDKSQRDSNEQNQQQKSQNKKKVRDHEDKILTIETALAELKSTNDREH